MVEPIYNSWGCPVPPTFGLDEKPLRALIGWKGIAIFDGNLNIIELLKNYLEAVQSESCGRCVPCRNGSKMMLDIVARMADGISKEADFDNLKRLAELTRDGSLCEFGRSFPIPVLDIINEFAVKLKAGKAEGKEQKKMQFKYFVAAPCSNSCPAHLDVPSYIQKIDEGIFEDSLRRIRQKTIFAGTLGRVCGRYCESNCRRNALDEPVNICGLKRFVSDYEMNLGRKMPKAKINSKPFNVAIVGAGPAGLSAAYQLALKGINVKIFEAANKAGGLLTSLYPEFKLPKEVIKREIEMVKDLGVEFQFNKSLGRDITLDELAERYEAVFLATGLNAGKDVKGNIYDARNLLANYAAGNLQKVAQEVLIVGSGHLAVDCARVAKRCGAQKALIVSELEEKAFSSQEVALAAAEGIEFIFNSKVEEISAATVSCDVGVLTAGMVIDAQNGSVDLDYLDKSGLLNEKGVFVIDSSTLATNRQGVFAGGEMVFGPSSLIKAIASGNTAAESIVNYLEKTASKIGEDQEFYKMLNSLPLYDFEEEDVIAGLPRTENPTFYEEMTDMEAVGGLSAKDALKEAGRCRRCYRMLMIAI